MTKRTILLDSNTCKTKERNRQAAIIYPQCGGIITFRGGLKAQRPNCGDQCNTAFTLTLITSEREVHLLAPDQIDISVGHLDWIGDF